MRMLHIFIAVLVLVSPAAAGAQQREPLVTIENEIEAARKQMATERRLVIVGELVLTSEESKAFWPVYNEYRQDMHTIGDEQVRLITDFAANYRDMSDALAERLLKDYLDIESRKLKVRTSYVRRFKKALPTIKVAKLYQVENKLDAVLDFQLASQIPMIE